MRNIRLDICYDGTRYQGWQRLSGSSNTIQGKLEQTLSRILDEEIEISGSGRTDAGVHAKAQVANFHCNNGMPCEELLSNLRRYLPEDIGIISCKDVSQRFHARLNAIRKTYEYRLWHTAAPCIFERKYVAQIPGTLDLASMRCAAKILEGTHDFSAFCANRHFKKSTIRTIHRLEIVACGDEIRFRITGNGFLHNMVRILVGTLIEVGRGERTADSVEGLFGEKREKAGFLAPAQGLCLEEVLY